jgi:hypothetical protein
MAVVVSYYTRLVLCTRLKGNTRSAFSFRYIIHIGLLNLQLKQLPSSGTVANCKEALNS